MGEQCEGSAVISPCEAYRYTLLRAWDSRRPMCGWIGLNPSTADHRQDDPTIRRMIGFARGWGFGGILVLNLFAFRATKPADMRLAIDPVGPDNDYFLRRYAPPRWVACWGPGGDYRGRADQVAAMFAGRLSCLGATKTGAPRHPLYVRSDTLLQAWPIPTEDRT